MHVFSAHPMNFNKCMYPHFSNPQQERGHFQNRKPPPAPPQEAQPQPRPEAAATDQRADCTAPYSGTGCAPGPLPRRQSGWESHRVPRVSALPSSYCPECSVCEHCPPTPPSSVGRTPSCFQGSAPMSKLLCTFLPSSYGHGSPLLWREDLGWSVWATGACGPVLNEPFLLRGPHAAVRIPAPRPHQGARDRLSRCQACSLSRLF